MKSIVLAASVIAFAALLVGVQARAAEEAPKKETKAQTKCPIMGGDIDKSVFADHDGKRVYFCCKGCPEKFKKDPAKYIKQLEDEGVTLDKTPVEKKDDSGKGSEEIKKDGDSGKGKHGCGGC